MLFQSFANILFFIKLLGWRGLSRLLPFISWVNEPSPLKRIGTKSACPSAPEQRIRLVSSCFGALILEIRAGINPNACSRRFWWRTPPALSCPLTISSSRGGRIREAHGTGRMPELTAIITQSIRLVKNFLEPIENKS